MSGKPALVKIEGMNHLRPGAAAEEPFAIQGELQAIETLFDALPENDGGLGQIDTALDRLSQALGFILTVAYPILVAVSVARRIVSRIAALSPMISLNCRVAE